MRGEEGGPSSSAKEGSSCAAIVPVLLMVAKVCVASYSFLMQGQELECVHGAFSNRGERIAVVRYKQ